MQFWAEMDGHLSWRGSPGLLSVDMPIIQALNIMYAATVENLDAEQRVEVDGWLTATADQMIEFQREQKERRRQLVMEAGEIAL